MIAAFSISKEVRAIVEQGYEILTFYVFIEPLSKIMNGIVTGLGKQGLASIFTLIGYWCVGIPMTLTYIYFHGGGIFGIWLGASVSIIFIFIF